MKFNDTRITSCPVCFKQYKKGSAKVAGNKNNSLVVHVCCDSCKHASMLMISKGPTGESTITVGMLTDLNYQETLDSLSLEAIDVDEVLDIMRQVKG